MNQRPFANLWGIDESIRYLNHGSFGACPKVVLEIQRAFRDRMEAQLVQFLYRDLSELLFEARKSLGRFVGAKPDDLAFIPNATTGVSTILRSLNFQPKDELLTTDHEYPACRYALDYVAERTGAVVTVAKVPFPLQSPDQVTDAILERVTSRTRFALIDHVTSPTGLVWPVSDIVAKLAARQVDTMVDGSHAPGMIPLSIETINPAYYTANCHKWLCAPKGSALLYVRPDRQERIHPLPISHGNQSSLRGATRFVREFEWTGTDDPTAFLATPAAIDFIGGLVPGGWPAVMERNRALALAGRQIVCNRLGIAPPAPDSMIGSLAAIPMPDGTDTVRDAADPDDPLQRYLLDSHRIEIPVFPWPRAPHRLLRLSAQLYNTEDDYEALATALLYPGGPLGKRPSGGDENGMPPSTP